MPRRFPVRLFHAARPAADHVPDAELLSRYAHDRDSAAFELLVRRHADAVWAACARVLRNDADADDAFQAAFLVLARKAAAVRTPCVGGWLHRVAVNAALKLRAVRAGSVSDGAKAPSLTLPARTELERDETAAVVHEELARLPDRYRLPVVLCDLEGQTHAEAAKALNWPVGSVSGRLSRAHALLRTRLTRRGLAAPAVAAVLVAGPASVRAVATAVAAASGSLSVSPAVSTLAEGVLSAMRIAKLKVAAALVAVTGLLGLAGTGTVALLAQSPRPVVEVGPGVQGKPPPKPEQPPVVDLADGGITAFPELTRDAPTDLAAAGGKCPLLLGDKDLPIAADNTTYTKLLKSRVNTLRGVLRQTFQLVAAGRTDESTFRTICDLTDRLIGVVNELEGNNVPALTAWLRERVIVFRMIELYAEARVNAGTSPRTAAGIARERRLGAESDLVLVLAAADRPRP